MSSSQPLLHPDAATSGGADQSSIKETIISVIIAFALAFVFRGFVIEAFLIPTGSMAPTLRGAHMQFKSPVSGYEWAVTPWQYTDDGRQNPTPVQQKVIVHDPMTGANHGPGGRGPELGRPYFRDEVPVLALRPRAV